MITTLFCMICAGWCAGGIASVVFEPEPSVGWVIGIGVGVGWLFSTLKSINDRLLK